MASPVYGKQFIRFAETALIADATAIDQFSVVASNNALATDPPTAVQSANGGACWGVLQQTFNLASSGLATDLMRLGTVATSGLLLVRADPNKLQAQGDPLACTDGISVSDGNAVTVNSSAPIVRQQVLVGGVNMVLVSFN